MQDRVHDAPCADLGCSVGGFTDCFLKAGAAWVLAVDTAYGLLDYRLRQNPRVEVRERTNVLHLPTPLSRLVSIAAIDLGWTPQHRALPAALRLLAPGGWILSLVKPSYELAARETKSRAGRRGRRQPPGVLSDDQAAEMLATVREEAIPPGLAWVADVPSPIRGSAGSLEFWLLLRDAREDASETP